MKFMRKFFGRALLASAVLLAGFGDPQAQTGVSPSITFLETDQALPDGLWRINLNGDVFTISKNTAAANNFTTGITALSIDSAGVTTATSLIVGNLAGAVDGSVLFENGSGLIESSNIMIITASNNVGVGISPLTRFHTHSAGVGTPEALRVSNASGAQDRGTLIGMWNTVEAAGLIAAIEDAGGTGSETYFTIRTRTSSLATEKFRIGSALTSHQQPVAIDVNNAEALLVRQDGDTEDAFRVHTDRTTHTVEVGRGLLLGAEGNSSNQSTHADLAFGSANFGFNKASGNRIYLGAAGSVDVAFRSGNLGGMDLGDTMFISWSDNGNALGASVPFKMQRDNVDETVGTLEFRSALTPHNLRVYNTYTSATDHEYSEFGFGAQSDILTIGTVKGSGGGTARALSIRTDSVEAINIAIDQTITFEGKQVIDVNNAEAFLVRKNGDAGDVFTVSSSGSRVDVNGKLIVGIEGVDGQDETPQENLNVLTGNIEIHDSGTLGSESLQDGDFASFTNWTEAGDFSEGTANYVYLHSTAAGTLTQANANLTLTGKNNRWYKFTYTVSAVTAAGELEATITSAFAASAVSLNVITAGTKSVIFQSNAAASAADFVISATSDTASDTFTLDDLVLKEIIGGNLILAGKITGGGANGISVSGGGTVVTFETSLGTVGSTETVDWGNGNHQAVTLDENLTFTFIDPAGPGGFTMKLTQDVTGTNTVTWPASVLWEGDVAPTITVTGDAVDLVSFYFDGTNYIGSALQDVR